MDRLGQVPDHVLGLRRLLERKAGHAVELHETHISWVLVDDEFAYKLRKNIKLPFVDFSTLAARREDCQKEVTLNRRWAPNFYLGVVEVHGNDVLPGWDGPGQVVDFAVLMRRLPEGSLLKDLVAASRIKRDDMASLAKTISDVHEAAPIADMSSPASCAKGVGAALSNLLDQLQRSPLDDADARRLDGIRAWVKAELARSSPWIEARALGGMVRDCHGDLHLGNIARTNEGWLLFDGLEFDDGLRRADVMSDLAFLTMDLKVHGCQELEFALLDGYLQHTGDHEGVRLLRLYEVHRALVRLLVVRMRGLNAGLSSGDAYLSFITASMERGVASQPCLVLMHGLSGSGKSKLSADIAVSLPAVRARSDVERKRLFGLTELADSKASHLDIYSAHANERTLKRLADCAEWALQGGWSFVADATFLLQADRDCFRALAQRTQCGFTIVHCEAELDTLCRRTRARGEAAKDASEATESVIWHQIASAEHLRPDELECALTVCTERQISSAGIAAICQAIHVRWFVLECRDLHQP
ncbi:MAG: AAA family ATPase [Aquabacterium sp.]|uniref:bifunctional aminoglycoside phosphotransferase/ATP-binding protein n=1 Tax=Aquabacterium sp. TaxID=1872578 RepID=UPI0027220236|nr:bifunctional aminoglycoside phosphotransferase/ATP-binding protein [Aquabacterium sp.]MDO9005803.1 AAA family ATPase [Aquabacterium sp.]